MFTFKILTVTSVEPQADDWTKLLGPVNVLKVKPLFKFQILISLKEPLANEPSANSAREVTVSVWPINVLIVKPVVTFKILIVPSFKPLANEPSDRKTREATRLV